MSLTLHRVGTNVRIGMLLVASQTFDASIAIEGIIAVIVNTSEMYNMWMYATIQPLDSLQHSPYIVSINEHRRWKLCTPTNALFYEKGNFYDTAHMTNVLFSHRVEFTP